MTLRRTLTIIALSLSCALARGQSADQHPDWTGKGQLFVGTCYQPVDRSPEQVRTAALIEKSVGLVARLIKLASFPPLRPLRKAAVELIDLAIEPTPASAL